MKLFNSYELMQPRGQLITGFINALLWCSHCDNDENEFLEELYSLEDIEQASAEKIIKLCDDFLALDNESLLLLEHNYGQAGHDLFLTMAGHGAGFWDGDWLDDGKILCDRVAALVNSDSVHVFDQDGQVFIEFSPPKTV